MGRYRTKPLGYDQITQQAEKTIVTLMNPANIKTNSEATKEQSVSRAFGAYMLWRDLTASYPNTGDDERLFKLLVVSE